MASLQTLKIPISGMDCAECTQHVQQAIEKLPGVESVDVFLATEKAIVKLDPSRVNMTAIRAAAQSLPDIGIMGNSARLLKQK